MNRGMRVTEFGTIIVINTMMKIAFFPRAGKVAKDIQRAMKSKLPMIEKKVIKVVLPRPWDIEQ
jgi:hypothetical protein